MSKKTKKTKCFFKVIDHVNRQKEDGLFVEELIWKRNYVFVVAPGELWYPIFMNKLSSVCIQNLSDKNTEIAHLHYYIFYEDRAYRDISTNGELGQENNKE